MRYDKYLNRINKLNKFLNFVYRTRYVLISAVSLIVAGTLTLEFTKGITKIENFTKFDYVYGDDISISSTAFLNDATLEFKAVNETEWSEEKPIYPGEYYVRSVSNNGFGSKTESDPIKFSIAKKDVEIYISESQITYGNKPLISASLIGRDTISDYTVKFDDEFTNKTKAVVDKDSVSILDKDGKDLTFCYNIIPVEKEINILPRSISVSFDDNEKIFDKKEIEEFDGKITSGSLAPNDVISFVENETKHSEIGQYKYQKDVVIKRGDKDVTFMYNVNSIQGNLNIKKIPLVAYSLDYEEQCNERTLLENNAYQANFECPNILEGHQVNITFDGEYETLKDEFRPLNTTSTFAINVTDSEGTDVSKFYDIQKTYGNISVLKRDISIEFGSETKLYDGISISSSTYSVSANLFAEDNVKIEADLFPTIVEPGTISNIVTNVIIENPTLGDVTDIYNINFISGELAIKKPNVTFDMPTFGEITYDGEIHLLDNSLLKLNTELSDQISSDFTYELSNGPTECVYADTYYSHVENGISPVRIKLGENDVTSFFNINCPVKTSIIRPRNINPIVYFIENNSDSVTYNSYGRQIGIKFNEGEMIDTPSLNTNQVLYAGEYQLSDLGFNIYNEYGRDVTSSYNIASVNYLTINKKEVSVVLPTATFNYDGQNHYVSIDNNQFVGENAICDNDYTYSNTLVMKETGDYSYTSEDFYCSNSENYIFTFDAPSKVSSITKRDLTVDFETFDKEYTGNYQYLRFNITQGSLAPGHNFVNTYFDGTSYVSDCLTVKNKGVYKKSNFAKTSFFRDDGKILILDENGQDVTDNYNLIDDFDSTSFEVKPFALTVTFDYQKIDRVYNGWDYVFDECSLDRTLPNDQYYTLYNAYTAKRAGEYTNNKNAYIEIYDLDGNNVTGNYTLKYNCWSKASIKKADVTIEVLDFNPTYDGLPFYLSYDNSYSSAIRITSGSLYEDAFYEISYKNNRDSIFISNTSMQDLVDLSLHSSIYDDVMNDYNLTIVYGTCNYNKRDLIFKGKASSHTYDKQVATNISVVPSGDTEFYSRHTIKQDKGAVSCNAIYGGKYGLIVDATKFHLENKNAGNVNVDDYVNFNFTELENKVTIVQRKVTLTEKQDILNYGERKAYEKFSISNLVENDQIYIVDKDGNKELIESTKTDYQCIIDMYEKTPNGTAFKCYDSNGEPKTITNKQFKVYTMIDGVLTDISSSYTIDIKKENARRSNPIWIK